MPGTSEPETAAASRAAVLAFRFLLLALAAGALVAAGIVGGTRDRGGPARYVCPMHPEVVAAEPGTCPICRMELEPVALGETPGSIKASTYQVYDTMRRRGNGPDVGAPAWVEDDGIVTALFYDDVLAWRAPDKDAEFSPSSAAGVPVPVHATSDAPERWDRSTSRMRFRSDEAGAFLRHGDVGWLRLAVRPSGPPVIPYSAVLEGADGPYVLVASADSHRLTKRPVEIGRVFGSLAAVLSGLRARERVLIRSAFYVDAERRLRGEDTIKVEP